jgi:hypothetical protein
MTNTWLDANKYLVSAVRARRLHVHGRSGGVTSDRITMSFRRRRRNVVVILAGTCGDSSARLVTEFLENFTGRRPVDVSVDIRNLCRPIPEECQEALQRFARRIEAVGAEFVLIDRDSRDTGAGPATSEDIEDVP